MRRAAPIVLTAHNRLVAGPAGPTNKVLEMRVCLSWPVPNADVGSAIIASRLRCELTRKGNALTIYQTTLAVAAVVDGDYRLGAGLLD